MTRRVFSLFLALMLLGSLVISVSAVSLPDLTQNGTITFNVRYDGKPVSGGSLTIYRVGDIVEDDGDYVFRLTSVIDDKQSIVEDPQDLALAKKVAEIAQAAKVPATTVEIDDGKAYFPDVATGLYVVVQLEVNEGFEAMSPFLISVPQFKDGQYTLNVVANPKTPVETIPETTKPTEPKDDKIPQTGQLNWPVPMLVAGGLLLFALGWYLRFGTKKETYED